MNHKRGAMVNESLVAVVVSGVAIAGQLLCSYVVLKVKAEVMPILSEMRAQLESHDKSLTERHYVEKDQWKAINLHGERLSSLEAKLNSRKV